MNVGRFVGSMQLLGLWFVLFSPTEAMFWPTDEGNNRRSQSDETVDPRQAAQDRPRTQQKHPAVEGYQSPYHPYSFPTYPLYPEYEYPYPPYPDYGHSYPREKCSCNCNNTPGRETVGVAHCEWRVVFKAVAGDSSVVLDDFLTGGYINSNDPSAMTVTSSQKYRDRDILDNWNNLFIKRVKIEVFMEGVSGAWFLFNGIGSNIKSWMQESRLIASSYSDLKQEPAFNYFSVDGDSGTVRRFMINTNYNGCDSDTGYLLVVDDNGEATPCDYESGTKPYFIFSQQSDDVSWNTGAVGLGDRFVISARVCEMDW